MFPLTNSLRVSYLVCTCAPWGSGWRGGEGSSRGGSLRFRKCRGFERVIRADKSSQQGVLQSVLSPSPGASLCSCILLIVKHADRRRECGCFTGPHELSTGSGSSGPSWNHVPWRNSQVNRESRRFLRRPRGGCPGACGCIVLHAPDRRHLSRFWNDKPCSTAMPAGPHTFESRVGWTRGSFP